MKRRNNDTSIQKLSRKYWNAVMMGVQVEPYYDEEEDSEAAAPSSRSLENNEGEDTTYLKPMLIDIEYTDEIREASLWKANLAAVLSIIFVVAGCVITRQYRANYYAAASDSNKQMHPRDGLDDDYFLEIMHHIQRGANDSASLCTDKFVQNCYCHNPFEPIVHPWETDKWRKATKQNVELLKANYSKTQPDFVIYGDSITEHLLGRASGRYIEDLKDEAALTYEMFTKEGGGRVNGLPMGVGNDTIANLLYRMQNGEMPESLHPKLWWILIGTNDLLAGCSADTIIAGNIRIVQEIRARHDSHNHNALTPIVINSILPRGSTELVESNTAWAILKDVNRRLECYAAITPEVFFVNATDLFVEKREGGVFLRDGYFKRDYLHPSVEGYRKWEQLIIEKYFSITE